MSQRLVPGFGYVDESGASKEALIPGFGYLDEDAGGASGTSATTNANDTSSASGTTTVTGTSAKTNANDTSSATGTTTVVGTLARTNADDTSDASGTVGSGGSTGTLATTNANDTSSASGTTTVVGTLAATNANDTPSASGWAGVVSGESATTNANDTSSASGSAGSETLRGRTRRRYKTPIPPDDVVLQAPVEEAPSVTTLLPDANTLIVTKGREVIRLSKVAKEKRRAAQEAKDEEAIERALMEWF